MRKIEVKTEGHVSQVLIGEKLENVLDYTPDRKVVVITDEQVGEIYADKFPAGFPVITIGVSEKIKTLATVEYILQKMIDFEADRSTFVLAIGGGIVCDIAGFAASVYMRGLSFGFVSTTLLSQVDASVGGKNGVNFEGFKNMVGVFNQPDFVICDIQMLKTLEKRDFLSGFAEIVKAGAIRDSNLFQFLEDNYEKALDFDYNTIEKIVYDSVLMKSEVVEEDEKEKGLRRILNFGHTFAHSFEKHIGITHGEAVSVGMVLAARLSAHRQLIENSDAERIKKLLENIGLPVAIELNKELIVDAMKKDKKRKGEEIALVLIDQIGRAVISDVPVNQLENIIYDLC
jgi:3-dehydroquinate synthase